MEKHQYKLLNLYWADALLTFVMLLVERLSAAPWWTCMERVLMNQVNQSATCQTVRSTTGWSRGHAHLWICSLIR